MRKILLIAAVLFSLGSMAQKPLNSFKNLDFSTKAMKMNIPTENMHTGLLGKAAKAQTKAPDGTPKTFYLDFLNSCYGMETIFGIVHYQSITKPSILYTVTTTRFTSKT